MSYYEVSHSMESHMLKLVAAFQKSLFYLGWEMNYIVETNQVLQMRLWRG